MFKIRYKIITGFAILGIMLVISGLISIYEPYQLGNQVNRLLWTTTGVSISQSR